MAHFIRGLAPRWSTRALLMGSIAAMAAVPAFAQETPPVAAPEPTTVDEVVVTGFRGSLQQAINVKRRENSIVDAISAEDIADFPDLNLADSLQRVPGVQIERDGGEGRSINVRGLSSDFVRVRLNGLEALATTGGRDQGRANRNRGFDFNVFASELFNRITVRKSQEAVVNEGSLGATVDLQTARPFDYDGFTMAAGIQGSYNDLTQKVDPRGTFLVSNRWMDGRLGALVSVAYSERQTYEEGSSSVGFRSPAADGCVPTQVGGVITSYVGTTRCWGSVGTITDASGATLTGLAAQQAAYNAAYARIPRYGRIAYERERLGITGSVQFDLTPATRLTFDSLYAKLDQRRSEEFLGTISGAREAGVQGFRAMGIVSGRVDENGTLIAATLDNVDMRVEQRVDYLSTEFIQNSLGVTHEFSDRLRLSALFGRSSADSDNPQQTTLSFERYDVDGYSYDYSNKNLPAFNYGFDVTNPANWQLSSSAALGDASIIRMRPNTTENTYDTAEVNLDFDVNDALTLRGGVSWKKFGFDVVENRRAVEAIPATALARLAAQGITIASYSTLMRDFGRGLDVPAGTPTTWVLPDLDALTRLIGLDCNCVNDYGDFRLTPFDGEIRSVEEASTGVFLQADFDLQVAGMPVRGNLGARYVDTKVDTTGIVTPNTVTIETGYSDTLPSFNISIEPMENLIVRFAAAKTLARAALNQLTPGGSVNTGVSDIVVTAGNPFLEPIRSNNLDLSIEWYPYPEALFSVALFKKDISTFIQQTRERMPFSQTGLPNSILPVGVSPDDDVLFIAFQNTPGGELSGFEVTLQTPLTFLPDPFDGFGVLLNYTKVDSEVEYITNTVTGASVKQPIVGQSPNSWSATLYYEKGPFEARVSGTYRDEYLVRVPSQWGNDVDGKAESLNIDMSASYKISDRLTATLEGINLTDEFDERWVSSERMDNFNYEHTGREFVVGLRYRY